MAIKKAIKNISVAVGLDGYLYNKYLKIQHLKDYLGMGFPPGHFYSPITSLDEVRENEEKIFRVQRKYMDGVDTNEGCQLKILKEFEPYLESVYFPENKTSGFRYYSSNPSFSYGDATVLSLFLRHYKPKRIIEIGSGSSSGVMLDTNEKYMGNSVKLTCIEPYPDYFYTILNEEDRKSITIIEKKIQDVELKIFDDLEAGDIMFVDSSHVSKINSDVNHIFFEILPTLKQGVIIHFHDISYGYEYPREWAYKGWSWNEAYLLRAFLQYNNKFEILFFNNFIARYHKDKLMDKLPNYGDRGEGSIWLRKK